MTSADVLAFWRRGRGVERAGYVVGALLLASGLIHLAVLVIGGGSWQGPLSLRKPTTFGLSFGLTVITIVWVASFLRLGGRTRAALLGTFTIACVLEAALVSLQAWRGVPSHFNMETTFDALIGRWPLAGSYSSRLSSPLRSSRSAPIRRSPSASAWPSRWGSLRWSARW